MIRRLRLNYAYCFERSNLWCSSNLSEKYIILQYKRQTWTTLRTKKKLFGVVVHLPHSADVDFDDDSSVEWVVARQLLPVQRCSTTKPNATTTA